MVSLPFFLAEFELWVRCCWLAISHFRKYVFATILQLVHAVTLFPTVTRILELLEPFMYFLPDVKKPFRNVSQVADKHTCLGLPDSHVALNHRSSFKTS